LNNFPSFADYSFQSMFLATIAGSIGETSALACLIGAAVLIITGVGSFRIMAGVCVGVVVMGATLFLGVGGSGTFSLPVHYQFVMGGLAFGMVFMATDPVSASHTGL